MQDVAHATAFILTGRYATYGEALTALQANEADCIIDIPYGDDTKRIHDAYGVCCRMAATAVVYHNYQIPCHHSA